MSTAVRLGAAAVVLIATACAATSTEPSPTSTAPPTTSTAPATTSAELATTSTHRPGRGGVVESEVSDSVGVGGGVSPNGGFVSLSVSVSCAFRGDGSAECWRPRERPESPGWITIDGFTTRGRCGIRIDGSLQCWDGEDAHIGGPPEDPYLPYLEFPFPGRRFTALSGGYELACAIDVERALACTLYGYPIDLGDYMPDGEFVSVAAGLGTTCGVRVDGTVGCVGGLEFDGEFVSVAVGRNHVCKVRVGGEVVCSYWGDGEDDYGKASPPDGSFSDVVANPVASCGLRVDGEVVCWGLRDSGPVWGSVGAGWNLDGGSWPQGPFTALDMGLYTDEICALRVGGQVVCWNNGSATHEPPGGVFVAVDAGPTATCGLRPDGEVECWGYDEPGYGSTHPYLILGPLDWDPPAGPFTAISVGDEYACALRGDGEAVCWGRGRMTSTEGEDGTRGEREIRRRLRPPPGPFTAISAGDNFTCALRGDGEAVCWGLHTTWDEVALAAPPPGPFVAIRAGSGQACALRPDGEAVCWNTGDGAQSALDGSYRTLIGGVAAACGLRLSGELACADADHRLARHAPDITFRTVAALGVHACGVDFAGEITCWHSEESWHEPTPPGPFSAVTVGAEHACALRPDGTAECWTPHWPPGAAPAATAPSPPS